MFASKRFIIWIADHEIIIMVKRMEIREGSDVKQGLILINLFI